jgi:hypothetical protein
MKHRHRPLRTAAFALIVASAASGCTLGLNLNANRFDSPETRGGRLRGHLDALNLQGSNTLQVVPSLTANPLQINAPSFDRSNLSYRVSGGVGVFEDFDLDLKIPWHAPVLLQAKYQLLGAHELSAQAGNFALAISGGAGLTQPSGDLSDPVTGVNGKYDLSFTTYDLALIAGYRAQDAILVYGGPFFTSLSYSGTLTQSGAVTALFPLSGSATQNGVNLGVQFDSVIAAIKIEEAWAHANVQGQTRDGFYSGVSASFRF